MQDRRRTVRFVLLGAVLVLSTKRAFCFNSIPSQQDVSEDGNSDGTKTYGKTGGGGSGTATGSGTKGKIPFVGPLHLEYQDPFAKGFEITTRVYTDPHDTLAHFDDSFRNDDGDNNDSDNTTSDSSPPSNPIVLPYWECGVAGSTTVPVPLSSLTVRHLLGGSKPGSFEGGCGRGETVGIGGGIGRGMGIGLGGGSNNDDTHPRLVVPLTPMEIVLNSGQTRIFLPGDVILLENCLTGGHILQGHEGHDMVVMMLTLPHPYHHAGRDRNSLSSIFENNFWKQNPCKTGLVNSDSENGASQRGRRNDLVRWSQTYKVRRRLGLGVIGAGISLALADFLGKVAPLALAVAAGGGLVAVGGTYGIVKLGEYGLDELEFWNERRLLQLQDGAATTAEGFGEEGGDKGGENENDESAQAAF